MINDSDTTLPGTCGLLGRGGGGGRIRLMLLFPLAATILGRLLRLRCLWLASLWSLYRFLLSIGSIPQIYEFGIAIHQTDCIHLQGALPHQLINWVLLHSAISDKNLAKKAG